VTIITVRSIEGRLGRDQRARLAESLSDAVLVPEVGQYEPTARIGFQVHFIDLAPDCMAIAGKLASDTGADILTIDIAVMEAAWPRNIRAEVINRVYSALAEACDVTVVPPTWWVNFRVIDEGSWGSRGGVLSIFDLLNSGVFTEERRKEIEGNLGETR
jgi:phenylpyruvate tautomerase PptA (4-oxalocrotonate tautomerase family)